MGIGVDLDMPSTYYLPGDICYLTATIYNDLVPREDVAFFVVLEVYGNYWMYPSWDWFDGSLVAGDDYKVIDVPLDIDVVTIIPQFIWPEGAGALDSLFFYGALLEPDFSAVIGNMDIFQFSYGY